MKRYIIAFLLSVMAISSVSYGVVGDIVAGALEGAGTVTSAVLDYPYYYDEPYSWDGYYYGPYWSSPYWGGYYYQPARWYVNPYYYDYDYSLDDDYYYWD